MTWFMVIKSYSGRGIENGIGGAGCEAFLGSWQEMLVTWPR